MMKFRPYLILLLFSISIIGGCKPSNETTLYADKGTGLVDGSFTPLNHWEGQWRLINIWAKWCKPCWQEIPELNEFHALQEPDIKLFGYNFDELSQEELQSLTAEMNIQFSVLLSWPEVWSFPEIKGLPATLIIAPDNQVVRVLLGPQTLEGLKQELEKQKMNLVNKAM